MKMESNHVMEFTNAIRIEYSGENATTVWLCYGKYWPIHYSLHPNQWSDCGYNSMDYINHGEFKYGWNSLTNIAEPIYLIHNCLQLTNTIKRQQHMPEDVKDMNLADWTRQLLHCNTEIHKHRELSPQANNELEWPCGPKWFCNKHNLSACTQCPKYNGRCTTKNWGIDWECNLVTQL